MTDNTPLNADDELHDAIYGIAELNIKNIESCEMMYAVRPFRLIKFIKKYELQARVAEIEHVADYTNGMTNQMFENLKFRIAELEQELEKL